MSVRKRPDGRVIVEVYDPATKKKRQLTNKEIRALGLEPPTTLRQGRQVERASLDDRDRRAGHGDEDCEAFALRWPDDYRRGKGGRERNESTTEHNRERVKGWGRRHRGRTLRSYTRVEARAWAALYPGTVPALRAMFYDALDDKIIEENPFARLGLSTSRGRADLIVLTKEEIELLARIALEQHGPTFGVEIAAMIIWAAYTLCRPGETFAARYSRLNGDVYNLGAQFNSRLRKETSPKHNSDGLIFVPEPAQRAVLDKPRRLGDDLMFRTRRGKQFRQQSWHYDWNLVRHAFVNKLPDGHHLKRRIAENEKDQLDFHELRHFGASYMLNELEIEPWVIAEQLRHSDGGILVTQLYGHPDRRRAIDRIRRAYGANVKPLPQKSGANMGPRAVDSAS